MGIISSNVQYDFWYFALCLNQSLWCVVFLTCLVLALLGVYLLFCFSPPLVRIFFMLSPVSFNAESCSLQYTVQVVTTGLHLDPGDLCTQMLLFFCLFPENLSLTVFPLTHSLSFKFLWYIFQEGGLFGFFFYFNLPDYFSALIHILKQ